MTKYYFSTGLTIAATVVTGSKIIFLVMNIKELATSRYP
jgi:hypothetical protein